MHHMVTRPDVRGYNAQRNTPSGEGMTLQRMLSLIAVGVITVAACSDRTTTAPGAALSQAPGVDKAGASSTDSVPPQLAASFNVSGRVLAVSRSAPVAGSADTLHFDSVAGAAIKVYRNVLVNGAATQVLAAETTSGAGGEYRVNGLAGGYYVVQAAAPAGSPYADSFAYVAGTASEMKTDVYLWRKP
jgi:hypothetical protein